MVRHSGHNFAVKKECDDIIDAFIGDMERYPSDDGSNRDNTTLRHSSRKALESVFNNPSLKRQALSYFRELKEKSGKETYQEMANESGDSEFKRRVGDVRKYLTENSRKLEKSDLLNPRVFEKTQIGAVAVAAVLSPLAVAGATVMACHPNTIIASVNNAYKERVHTYDNIQNRSSNNNLGVIKTIDAYMGTVIPAYIKENKKEIQKGEACGRTVTKVDGEKSINSSLDGNSQEAREFLGKYERLGAKHKHALFEKMTGDICEELKYSFDYSPSNYTDLISSSRNNNQLQLV